MFTKESFLYLQRYCKYFTSKSFSLYFLVVTKMRETQLTIFR